MIGAVRWTYWGTAWLFVGSIVLQVFLVGLALFAGQSFEAHRMFGFTAVHLISLVLIPLAWLARAGRRTVWLSVLLFVVVTVQVASPGLRGFLPLAAALHPVIALLIFGLAVHLARHADELRRVPLAVRQAGPETVPEGASTRP